MAYNNDVQEKRLQFDIDKQPDIILQNLLHRSVEIAMYNATVDKRKVDVVEINDVAKNMIKIFKARLKDI